MLGEAERKAVMDMLDLLKSKLPNMDVASSVPVLYERFLYDE